MSEQQQPAVGAERKARRWLAWTVGWAIAFAVAFFAGIAYDRHNDEVAWREACAALDRRDPRWRWEQLQADRPPLADDQNAALVALRAADGLGGRWPDWGSALPLDRVRADEV